MVVRISTHNGSKAHREHNIRKDYVVSSQDHIDTSRSSLNEIWADEKHSQAYKRIFGQALEEYNNRQKRADRKIKDYYRHICKDEKKHPVYEMIVQVGGMNDNIPLETHKAILREFYNAFCEKNSSFAIFLLRQAIRTECQSRTVWLRLLDRWDIPKRESKQHKFNGNTL